MKAQKIQSRKALLGSGHVKAACKMLVTLTIAVTTEKLQAIHWFKKAGHKMIIETWGQFHQHA